MIVQKPTVTGIENTNKLKWSYFLGQFCGLAKMHQIYVRAAFRISASPKYTLSGVRLSSAV